MADPLTSAELEHARWLATNRPDVTSTVVAGLLATLDAERDRHIGVLCDLHKHGVFALDRRAFGRWVTAHWDTEEGRFACTALASLTSDEVDAHPEARERDVATARRLYAEHFPEGSRIRQLAERGAITSGREAAIRAWAALPNHERMRARFPGTFEEAREIALRAVEGQGRNEHP